MVAMSIFPGFEDGECDPSEDYPDEPDDDECLLIPRKHDLDLGNHLLRRFAYEIAPQLADDISGDFHAKRCVFAIQETAAKTQLT